MCMESMDGKFVMDTDLKKRELSPRDKLVLDLWNKGLTGLQIGVKIGATRSAILGLINRLRKAGYVEYRAKNPRPKKEAPQKPKTARQKKLDQFELLLAAVPPIVVPEPIQEPCKPLTIMQLTRRSCRYVLNDGKPSSFLFCGKTTDRGSYCEEHHKICFTVIQKSSKPFMMNNKLLSSVR
jgi:hypothetical protein